MLEAVEEGLQRKIFPAFDILLIEIRLINTMIRQCRRRLTPIV